MPLLVLPLATQKLGESYDALLALISLGSLITTISLGQGPAVCYRVAKYATQKDEPKEGALFICSLASGLLSATLISIVIFILSQVVPPATVFGENLAPYSPILKVGLVLLSIQVIINALNGGAVNMYTGYMETHKIRLQMMISYALMVIITPIIILKTQSTILVFVAIVGIPTILQLTLLINLLYFDRPYLRNSLKEFNIPLTKTLFKDNILQSIADIGTMASRQLPVLAAGFLIVSQGQVGLNGTFLVWHTTLLSVFMMFISSITPAFSHALQENDWPWIDRINKKLALGLLGGGTALAIPLVFIGPLVTSKLYAEGYQFTLADFAALALALITASVMVWQSTMATSMGQFPANVKSGIIQTVVAVTLIYPASKIPGVWPLALCMITSDIARSTFLYITYLKFRSTKLAILNSTS